MDSDYHHRRNIGAEGMDQHLRSLVSQLIHHISGPSGCREDAYYNVRAEVFGGVARVSYSTHIYEDGFPGGRPIVSKTHYYSFT